MKVLLLASMDDASLFFSWLGWTWLDQLILSVHSGNVD